MNAGEMVLSLQIIGQFQKLISGLIAFIWKKVINAFSRIFWLIVYIFFRIYESSQLVSLSENTLSYEKTSTSNLNSEKLNNSEINLTYQSSSRSMNYGSLNSLSEMCQLRLRSVNRVLIGNLNIDSIKNKFDQLKDTLSTFLLELKLSLLKRF